ncbi:hypothetical protein Bbelb_124770 [Branchiostoma belcheri]|nr:hypothetical protein Bbelb_124770 [Branchiostoma belcheri]
MLHSFQGKLLAVRRSPTRSRHYLQPRRHTMHWYVVYTHMLGLNWEELTIGGAESQGSGAAANSDDLNTTPGHKITGLAGFEPETSWFSAKPCCYGNMTLLLCGVLAKGEDK